MSSFGPEFAGVLPPCLSDKYEVIANLKSSADRQTFLLRRNGGGALFVLKRSGDNVEDLSLEYEFLTQLRGEGMPEAVDFFKYDGASYLLREYIAGQTLLDYMQKRGALPTDEVVGIMLSVSAIVKRLHNQSPPVIHRDIKAENIVRTDDGGIYLIDFGIARRFDPEIHQDTHVLGTPLYSPPEQYGYRQTDTRSDIYSMGVLMHELLTGESELGRGAGKGAVAAIIDKCTRFDPDDRYSSVEALEHDLKSLTYKRRRVLLRAAAIAAAVIVAVAAAAVCAQAARTFFVQTGESESTAALSDGETYAATDAATDVETDAATTDETDAEIGGSRDIPDAAATYTFSSSAIEAEVCRILGLQQGNVTYGDLERVETLLLCGGKSFENWDDMMTHGEAITIGSDHIEENGTIDTLEDIAFMPNLKTLAVCDEQISDLSPLRGSRLERLALHGNNISDLSPLAGMDSLFNLVISDNPVSDLSPLAGMKLAALDIGATEAADLSPLADSDTLYRINLYECPASLDLSPLESIDTLNTFIVSLISPEQFSVVRRLSQLRYLYMWQVEGFTDYGQLDELDRLELLYVDTPGLESFDGLSQFDTLRHLEVRTFDNFSLELLTVDLEPLTKFSALEELSIRGVYVDDWEPLRRMPALKKVICAVEQYDQIKEVLDGTDVEISAF